MPKDKGNRTMKTHIKTVILLTAATILAACNTVQGVGQDVEAAGEKIEETARDAQG